MNLFTKNLLVDSAVTTGLVGTSTFTGVTIDAMRNPQIGDTKDYSDVIDSSSGFGMNLALAYLGIKYGYKVSKHISLTGRKTNPTTRDFIKDITEGDAVPHPNPAFN